MRPIEVTLMPEETPIIANAVARHEHITYLGMGLNNICRRTPGGSERIDVAPLYALCEQVLMAPKLVHLDLSHNPMGERGALIIAHLLLRSSTIETLHLDGCELLQEAKRLLGRALLHGEVKKLPTPWAGNFIWRARTQYVNKDDYSQPANDERRGMMGNGARVIMVEGQQPQQGDGEGNGDGNGGGSGDAEDDGTNDGSGSPVMSFLDLADAHHDDDDGQHPPPPPDEDGEGPPPPPPPMDPGADDSEEAPPPPPSPTADGGSASASASASASSPPATPGGGGAAGTGGGDGATAGGVEGAGGGATSAALVTLDSPTPKSPERNIAKSPQPPSGTGTSDYPEECVLQYLTVDEWSIRNKFDLALDLRGSSITIEDVILISGVLKRNKTTELLDLSSTAICGRNILEHRKWQRTRAAQRWQRWDADLSTKPPPLVAVGDASEGEGEGGTEGGTEGGEGWEEGERKAAAEDGGTTNKKEAGKGKGKKRGLWGKSKPEMGGGEASANGNGTEADADADADAAASPKKDENAAKPLPMLEKVRRYYTGGMTLRDELHDAGVTGYPGFKPRKKLSKEWPAVVDAEPGWWEVDQLQSRRFEPLQFMSQADDWDDWHEGRYGEAPPPEEEVDPVSLIVEGARVRIQRGMSLGQEGKVVARVGGRVRILLNGKPAWRDLADVEAIIESDDEDDDDGREGAPATLWMGAAAPARGQSHWSHEYESTAIEALGHMLAFNKGLLVLNLSNLGLCRRQHADHGDTRWEGLQAIAEGLRSNQTLTLLDLSFNGIGGDRREKGSKEVGHTGALILASLIDSNRSLRHLDLASNQLSEYSIEEEGLIAIAAAVSSSENITSLNLASNAIKVRGLEAVTSILAQPNSNLAAINLCANRLGMITEAPVLRSFADAVEMSRTLHSIDLRFNALVESEEAIVVIEAIENNVGSLVGFNGFLFKDNWLLRENVWPVLEGWYVPPPPTEPSEISDPGPTQEELDAIAAAEARREAMKWNEICKVCKHQYDPDVDGEPLGCPFAKLSAKWVCPNCAKTGIKTPKAGYERPKNPDGDDDKKKKKKKKK
eukprot:g1318.t1